MKICQKVITKVVNKFSKLIKNLNFAIIGLITISQLKKIIFLQGFALKLAYEYM